MEHLTCTCVWRLVVYVFLINVYVEFDMDEPPQPHDVMQSGGQMNAVFSSQISKYGPRDPEPVKILQQGIIKHLKVALVRPVLIKLRHQPRIYSAPETSFRVIFTVAIRVSFLWDVNSEKRVLKLGKPSKGFPYYRQIYGFVIPVLESSLEKEVCGVLRHVLHPGVHTELQQTEGTGEVLGPPVDVHIFWSTRFQIVQDVSEVLCGCGRLPVLQRISPVLLDYVPDNLTSIAARLVLTDSYLYPRPRRVCKLDKLLVVDTSQPGLGVNIFSFIFSSRQFLNP